MASGDITMSRKEATRLGLIISCETKGLSNGEAAKMLSLSRRQTIRVRKCYRQHGAIGLVSKKRGAPSNNRIPENTKQEVLSLIRTKYEDFGPTFLQEKLIDNHNIALSKETLRQIMIANGLWDVSVRRKPRIHQQRERRSRLGELVQIDGSHHDWFEGRRGKCCLLAFIDDATGKILHLRFEEAETTEGYFRAMRDYIKQYGLPIALYSDKHGVFRVNAQEATHEGETQFKRAMDNLGIGIIYANSAEAKGRVERLNQTLQDRLVKELRMVDISDIETANRFLPGFTEKHNARFAVEPKDKGDAHRQPNCSKEALDLIFSIQALRTVSKNLELSYDNVVYQIQTAEPGYALRHAKIMVCKDLSGAISLIYKNKKLAYKCYRKQKHNGAIIDPKALNQRIDEFIKNPMWIKSMVLLSSSTSVAMPAVIPTG